MAHYKSTGTTVERTTPREWLQVGAHIGGLVNRWAMRDDLVVYVGDRAAIERGAPALFDPASAEIEVNVPIAFGAVTPESVGDLRERKQQFEFPKASGAILHEALHARFTTWDLRKAAEDLDAPVLDALHLLEESRIESFGVKVYPENRAFLRACAMEIVLGDINDESLEGMSATRQIAQMLGLTYSRVDAGVLVPSDIDAVRKVVEDAVPTEFVEKLSDIWREFQTLNADWHLARMYELAHEWVQTIEDRVEETGEKEAEQQLMEALKEAIKEAAGSASIGAMVDADAQQIKEQMQEDASRANDKAKEQRDHKDVASKVFGRGSNPSDADSRSVLRETRNPTAEERISAVQIAQALEKARYRDRIRIESASATPPGRVRTRSLIQGEAYRDRGVVHEVEPFQRVQRKHTDDPNLTIGVMVDISGSMSTAMQPMASAAWILSEAVRRVQGKVAMVYYGNGVFPTLKVGQHLEQVKVYSASDGTEEFDDGFQALDGALNLLNGSGARMLVIVSDGEYRSDQQAKAKKWIARCGQAGVGVLWIGAGSYGDNAQRYCNGKESVFARMESSATASATMIGKAATKALTTAGDINSR